MKKEQELFSTVFYGFSKEEVLLYLKKLMETNQNEKTELAQRIDELTREKEAAEGQGTELAQEKDAVESRCAELVKEKDVVESRCAELAQEKEVAENRCAELAQEKEAAENRCAELQMRLNEAKTELEQLSAQFTQTQLGKVCEGAETAKTQMETNQVPAPESVEGQGDDQKTKRMLLEVLDGTDQADQPYVANIMDWIQQRLRKIRELEENTARECTEMRETARNEAALLVRDSWKKQERGWIALQQSKQELTDLLRQWDEQLTQKHRSESGELQGLKDKLNEVAIPNVTVPHLRYWKKYWLEE